MRVQTQAKVNGDTARAQSTEQGDAMRGQLHRSRQGKNRRLAGAGVFRAEIPSSLHGMVMDREICGVQHRKRVLSDDTDDSWIIRTCAPQNPAHLLNNRGQRRYGQHKWEVINVWQTSR